MRIARTVTWLVPALIGVAGATSTSANDSSVAGIEAFVKRRLPDHVGDFEFSLSQASDGSTTANETYSVTSTDNGKIKVEGSTLSAIMSGLHRYLADVAHVDIWWYIGSELDKASETLPELDSPIEGSSVVPYRYHWNTVTTSYTSAFWSWEDWELQLDWMALRGINLALAWIGVEKIFIDVFREIGLTDSEIESFLSGPAFLAWNHFGNIQGSWGGQLPEAWVNDQFALQKKILQRMIELGMTPILPAFPGFVPENITRVWPDVSIAKSPQWSGFSDKYTKDTYITPYDPGFAQLQKAFIEKQQDAYGNITKFWTLDQFNENKPASGELDYLRNVSHNTWKTLKAAEPSAVWVMQGWLFASDREFWEDERVEAFLSGIEVDEDMLLLDLFAESTPQWQRTKSFYGKPWIWCQLHDYGGNMGLYGQIENVTRDAMEAVQQSESIVGFGLSMEGQEGNEVMYDLLLDQAWNHEAIDTEQYFHDWVSERYGGSGQEVPQGLYSAWDTVRSTVYNNTDSSVEAVIKPILVLMPDIKGLTDRTGHHATKITYDASTLVRAWQDMYEAGMQNDWIVDNDAYQYDLVDWTRQVLANAFEATYIDMVDAYNSSNSHGVKCSGYKLQVILKTMDEVLATNDNFRLSTWIEAARKSGGGDVGAADFFEYNARDQVTLWGPTGEIEDYASKQWSGLVGGYYAPRWAKFVEYLLATEPGAYDHDAFKEELRTWETDWVEQTSGGEEVQGTAKGDTQGVVEEAAKSLADIFHVEG